MLLERFQTGQGLTVPVINALLRPFGLCYELLTVHTIVTYFMPIMVRIHLNPKHHKQMQAFTNDGYVHECGAQ